MQSRTLRRAALFAAVGASLEVLQYLIQITPDLFGMTDPAQSLPLFIGVLAPSLTWGAFFLAVYRQRSVQGAAVIAFGFGIIMPVFSLTLPSEISTFYRSTFREFTRIVAWAAAIGWAAFFLSVAMSLGRRAISAAAFILMFVLFSEALIDGYGFTRVRPDLHAGLGLAINLFASTSQFLFLWTLSRESASAPLTPAPQSL